MIDPDDYDWSSFRTTFYYNAHIIRVFRTFTQSAGLESFLVARSLYTTSAGKVRDDNDPPTKGDQYNWQFRHDLELSGEIIEYIEKERFVFTFADMQVDLQFRVFDDQTEVELVQSNIPLTDDGKILGHVNCLCSWTFFLTNLASVLTHDKDLRDENAALASSMLKGFVPIAKRIKVSD